MRPAKERGATDQCGLCWAKKKKKKVVLIDIRDFVVFVVSKCCLFLSQESKGRESGGVTATSSSPFGFIVCPTLKYNRSLHACNLPALPPAEAVIVSLPSGVVVLFPAANRCSE